MLVELDEEHTKCGICVAKFSSDRDNKDPEIRKHLPVQSSSQRCDHWFCHGCILREQLRVAEENNGKVPKWIRCMHCREKTSFNPAEPKYHRLLIDLLARAQKYAAAQVKAEQTEVEENEITDAAPVKQQEQNDAFNVDYAASEGKVDREGDDVDDDAVGSMKRESDITDLGEQEVKRAKLTIPSSPLVRVKEEPEGIDDDGAIPPERRALCSVTSVCVNCNIVKKKEEFDINESKKDQASVCMSCKEEEVKNREQKMMQRKEEAEKHAEAIKAIEENFEHDEASALRDDIQQMKAVYDQHVTKLEGSGSTIEKEMTKQSDLLYVVSSISRRGDQFGPCLHGIYTTCQKAHEAARKTFQNVSESYRDGSFVSHETRIAKCDMTYFLIPGVEGAFRPLFEVFKGEYEDEEDCTAVAINVVRIGTDVEQRLPYIEESLSDWVTSVNDNVHVEHKNSSAGTINKDAKVYAIFCYRPFDDFHPDMDVDLIGIYKDREAAMNRARAYAEAFIEVDEEQINDSYTSEVANGELFMTEEKGSVSIETVILDNEHGGVGGKEIELSVAGDSAWMNPQILWCDGY